jgi:hypothetical protein
MDGVIRGVFFLEIFRIHGDIVKMYKIAKRKEAVLSRLNVKTDC